MSVHGSAHRSSIHVKFDRLVNIPIDNSLCLLESDYDPDDTVLLDNSNNDMSPLSNVSTTASVELRTNAQAHLLDTPSPLSQMESVIEELRNLTATQHTERARFINKLKFELVMNELRAHKKRNRTTPFEIYARIHKISWYRYYASYGLAH